MMERMNNADFHKFLTEFSDAVAKGKYKKMPYDKYRTFKNWRNISIDVVLEHYTNLNGERVQRIRISPDGPDGYEFYIDDGSFGNFCYDYLKKEEPKVHPNEKKQYDIYGNVIENYYDYQSKCDKIDNAAKEAYLNHCIAKATGDSITAVDTSCVSNAADVATAGVSWYDSISTSTSDSTHATTATIATPSYVQTKTMVDVLQEDVEDLKKLVEGNNCEIATKANLSDVNRDIDALGDAIGETNMRIDECEYDLRERIEEARTAAIEESWYTRDELERMVQERLKALEDKLAGIHIVPVDKIITQSTSSNCYPAKNFKLNVGDVPCSDDRKEKENMDTNKMFNFDFGPVASHIRMSPYGLAIKSADNKFVSYDKESGSVVDVEVFNFDAQKFLYKMPVPVSQVAVGDVVVHMRKPMFVREVKGNVVSVVDIYNAEAKDILPVKSPFGFNFITKIVSLIDMSGANAETPFGNMLPLLMMGEGQDFKDILPLMLMTGNTGAFGNMNQNSLLWFAMMGDKGNMNDMLPFLLMGNMFQAPVTEHHDCCHGNHEHNGECHN